MKRKRQRKCDRAKRQNASTQRAAAARRRKLLDETYRAAERRIELLYDPNTPIAEVARLIQDIYSSQPVRPGTAASLRDKRGSVDEVLAIGEAMRADAVPEGEQQLLSALTFGAHAANLANNYGLSRRLMDQALQQADEPKLLLRLAAHLAGGLVPLLERSKVTFYLSGTFARFALCRDVLERFTVTCVTPRTSPCVPEELRL